MVRVLEHLWYWWGKWSGCWNIYGIGGANSQGVVSFMVLVGQIPIIVSYGIQEFCSMFSILIHLLQHNLIDIRCRAIGITEIWLDVWVNNPNSHEFHRKVATFLKKYELCYKVKV